MPALEYMFASTNSHVYAFLIGALMTAALYNTVIILVLWGIWIRDGHYQRKERQVS
jgi:uncharacterized membrane protein